MASIAFSFSFLFALLTFSSISPIISGDLILTINNNCPDPIWPAILPNDDNLILERGGFFLPPFSHRSIPVPSQPWSGRVWARTGCVGDLTCQTGDCGGKLECNGVGGTTPTTLAQLSLHQGEKDLSMYSVSLVDGFNIPLTVTPNKGQGVCPMVGCKATFIETCPRELQVLSPSGQVIACKSGCGAYKNDTLCCTGQYNNPQACKPSSFSSLFKNACPATFTYAYDTPSLIPECFAPSEFKLTFCH